MVAASTKSQLIIRADAGSLMGMGHLMRCLALAQSWQAEGGVATFVTNCESAALSERLKNEGFEIVSIDNSYPHPDDWPTTREVLAHHPRAWCIVDGYHFDAGFHGLIRQNGNRVLAVDDTAHLTFYDADAILNQNINAEELNYNCPPGARLLLGTRYALLRREFPAWREWKRETPAVARKILITMGGGDIHNQTLKAIRAVERLEVEGLEVKAVVGASNPHLSALEATIEKSPVSVELIRGVEDMSGLMAWADAGVSAAGSTCWEMAFMRLPLILIVTAENQTGIAAGLDEAGCAVNLGWFGQVSESDLADNVSELLFDEKRRGKMSEAGSKIVDGRGADRVIETLGLINSSSKISVNKEEGDQSRELSIRPATASDAELLWRWANDASVRERSFNPEPIPWQSHLDWFSRQLNSPGTSFYLLLEAGDPVGQIRYDRNEEESAAEISFSIAREHRGKGFGTEILLLTRERALLDLNCEKITAVVIEGNEASRKAFVRAGFKSDGPTEIRGRRALRFVWQPTEN